MLSAPTEAFKKPSGIHPKDILVPGMVRYPIRDRNTRFNFRETFCTVFKTNVF